MPESVRKHGNEVVAIATVTLSLHLNGINLQGLCFADLEPMADEWAAKRYGHFNLVNGLFS